MIRFDPAVRLTAQNGRRGYLFRIASVVSGNWGRRLWKSVADSYIRATRSSFSSPKVGPSNCRPIGNGVAPEVKPQGMEMPAMPAMLHVTVNTSHRYICNGSPVFSPALNAGVGVVGQRITSHFA